MDDRAIKDVEEVADAMIDLIARRLNSGVRATSIAAGIAVALTRLGETGARGAELRDAIAALLRPKPPG
ncbi:hypothetical protein [Methylobacterium oxalidis]|uniref:Uncharacterized protein n=1 Tax=Methylobacterium oxalidis TaxID=944322 RepID=A0A512JC87_9HYPH|nr:hypothetical protein [Methylobacterium oxalidis]GEP07576.1 hypothetical protein MOX02_56140 [Methylobacterium oxalidis]GJE34684.1 hypothetical protein LDDCCGHA_4897 [Methylobacterium oxalidis]GLS64444.1 hypothetical protein GCM10007888_28250 [Methylobacterium oxalidis]